jgi:hypothetical protein
VVNEPEEQKFSLKKSKFQQILGSGWRLHRIFSTLQFPDFFGWPTIKTNGKTQKLSSQHVSGGERARRAGIFLEKIKIQADSGICLALAWKVLQFPDFFGWPAIKTNGKTSKLSSKHDSGGEK